VKLAVSSLDLREVDDVPWWSEWPAWEVCLRGDIRFLRDVGVGEGDGNPPAPALARVGVLGVFTMVKPQRLSVVQLFYAVPRRLKEKHCPDYRSRNLGDSAKGGKQFSQLSRTLLLIHNLLILT